MQLADLEVFQSRPIAPTRRLALGRVGLPVDPAPGFGGLLLGAVAAGFIGQIDPELHLDLLRLATQVERGERIPQPRLRHRLQVDNVGLNRRTHRLFGEGEVVRVSLDNGPGTAALPQVLAAIYATADLPEHARGRVMELIRRGLHWHGAVEDDLVEYLTGRSSHGAWAMVGTADPILWALGVLGISDDERASVEVKRAFREGLRAAHPDHGGSADLAASRIAELTEARRILLAS